ncbi:inorganic triphosphatase [Glaciecola petra]|uniref:CYTH domain-containing protein n=1 Tax=Glaciecola petra TaxID=3075602 RepID=A0ABU2ZNZ2_9ALTE|nr:CYTH domain-containing protein [Aestuariibacter sp. P117]MDT0593299.1 CYTH domain-containing protein [Aestuariibacter sp. P117]
MEIELKLVCTQDALGLFESKMLDIFASENISVSRQHAHLYNEYYDTPELFLGSRKIGFRVRAKDNQYEQTIKTRGQVEGGLHQRPEYNIPLSDNKPDLSKFNPEIWPQDFDLQYINESIESLFSTDFERTTFELTHKDYKMEVVFDLGEVKHRQNSLPICEIELELVEGDKRHLFNVAELMVNYIPCRLSDVTKAARGYQLYQGNILELKRLPKYLPLTGDDSTEEAFCKLLQMCLKRWQYNQYVYAEQLSLKVLQEIRNDIQYILQGVALFLPVLQCQELLTLHKLLLKLSQAWAWQEQLQGLRDLRSKKGPFSKRIPKNQNLMNYLLGRREGLLNAYKPLDLNLSSLSAKVQLSASRVLLEKPWRNENSGANIAVKKHASGWLSQSWQTMLQSMSRHTSLDDKQYLALEVMLRQALINGFILADLFTESRGQFRAPWQDLHTGIQELKALRLLRDSLDDIPDEDRADLANWIEDKTHSVIKVMEQTRKVAMDAEIYW